MVQRYNNKIKITTTIYNYLQLFPAPRGVNITCFMFLEFVLNHKGIKLVKYQSLTLYAFLVMGSLKCDSLC